ncbi:MAG TPA: uroporphyrinogen decarboxylase [Clostridiales bacterium]|nr:uroporphyrinogen decarboxylase [Clostridiales bacterium]
MKTGRELVISAINREYNEKVPWVPFIGCHSGLLINKAADEVLSNTDLLVQAQLKAAKLYKADGIPVTFDLQIEAEALGCNLKWEKYNPPAVVDHILDKVTIDDLVIPNLETGRIPMVMEAARRLRKELPDTAIYGLITGPFTLALHLMGSNLFINMYDDPDGLKELLSFCKDVGKVMIDGYIQAGCDVIAVVDPMTSQISPIQFLEFVTPECTALFEHVRRQGRLSSFFVCGHALKNLEVMCDCRPDNVSVDENIPLDLVKEICLQKGVSFGGNLRLTTALLNGTPELNAVHAYECLTIGGNTGYIMSPGCDIPYNVPPENLIAVAEVVKDEYKRQVAAQLAQKGITEDYPLLDMSEYGRTDKVIVDIITLDSEACAPCQYMVESVKEVAPEFDDIVIWREHKIKFKESVTFMASLMVKNIPTICIDGQIKFVSTIPSRNELIRAIQDRINEKLKLKIKRKQGKIIVVVDETEESQLTLENVNKAIMELGLDIDVEKVTDKELANSYGAKQLPAIIFSISNLKSWGKAPDIRVIKEWLKELS